MKNHHTYSLFEPSAVLYRIRTLVSSFSTKVRYYNPTFVRSESPRRSAISPFQAEEIPDRRDCYIEPLGAGSMEVGSKQSRVGPSPFLQPLRPLKAQVQPNTQSNRYE